MRIAILISGRGSNMRALISCLEKKEGFERSLLRERVFIAASKPCAGINLARKCGFSVWMADPGTSYRETDLHNILQERRVDLICLAGFMRLLSASFVQHWQGRLINIHPSLLPAFPGLDTHRRALERGVKYHGCTVHFVDEGMDTGRIIDQKVVPVLPDDNEKSLAARVLAAEHVLYPEVLCRLIEAQKRA